MASMNNHVLVTGGTGFVATHVLNQLLTVNNQLNHTKAFANSHRLGIKLLLQLEMH
jgi:nucleoside-diphosphate-sugar epimerase